jgi:hypothetical protein
MAKRASYHNHAACRSGRIKKKHLAQVRLAFDFTYAVELTCVRVADVGLH